MDLEREFYVEAALARISRPLPKRRYKLRNTRIASRNNKKRSTIVLVLIACVLAHPFSWLVDRAAETMVVFVEVLFRAFDAWT